MEFNATEVSFEYSEYDVLVIYFESDSNYLMIQYKDNHSELDVTLGMDTYHIERDNQGLGGYGGVKNWSLSDDSIFIGCTTNFPNINFSDWFNKDNDYLVIVQTKRNPTDERRCDYQKNSQWTQSLESLTERAN